MVQRGELGSVLLRICSVSTFLAPRKHRWNSFSLTVRSWCVSTTAPSLHLQMKRWLRRQLTPWPPRGRQGRLGWPPSPRRTIQAPGPAPGSSAARARAERACRTRTPSAPPGRSAASWPAGWARGPSAPGEVLSALAAAARRRPQRARHRRRRVQMDNWPNSQRAAERTTIVAMMAVFRALPWRQRRQTCQKIPWRVAETD